MQQTFEFSLSCIDRNAKDLQGGPLLLRTVGLTHPLLKAVAASPTDLEDALVLLAGTAAAATAMDEPDIGPATPVLCKRREISLSDKLVTARNLYTIKYKATLGSRKLKLKLWEGYANTLKAAKAPPPTAVEIAAWGFELEDDVPA
ncbi:hypothetical protein D9619_002143 [Psilocybe cf. subviscida]|uniref:Uncharacterized protein n=1 Tax=Psilocybe cf. subviscida TaxID=2480587 RepID=A0A8H5BEW0_9AGAR|nr:hypothetical protein D9619_002143 [Psilocybe cf. subviscida]